MGILEDEGDRPLPLPRRDLAEVGPLEPRDDPQQRRLAAPRRAEEGDEIPRRDVEVDPVDGDQATGEALPDPGEPDTGGDGSVGAVHGADVSTPGGPVRGPGGVRYSIRSTNLNLYPILDRHDEGGNQMKPGSIDRRSFVLRGLAAGTAAAIAPVAGRAEEPKELTTAASAPAAPVGVPPFPLLEASIASLSAAQADGRYTARKLVELCLERVEAVDRGGPKINSIIELNPDALAIADALDAERKAKGARGAMHGIPVLLKDNIGTADRMRTSAGSLALAESTPLQDAFLVERLRAAGAVILGKTNLSEWANIRSTRSTSGWSGRGGLTRNPHVLDRSTSGSSSGSGAAVAAAIVPVAVGSETDGSIVSPSSICGIVGLKPTVGLVSRSGIIPISSTQDTAGPMARSVEDAAILLGVLAGIDPRDAATGRAKGKIELDYRRYLDPKGLSGRRIGVARALAGFHPDADRAFEEALGVLKKAGAILVDPVPLPTNGKFDDAEMEVLLFELKAEMEKYLSSLGPKAPARTLADLVAFNEKNRDREMPWFGQALREGRVEGATDRQEISEGARRLPEARRDRRAREGDEPQPPRRPRFPVERPGLDARPRERRPLQRRQQLLPRRRRLADDHRADGLHPRAAARPHLHRPPLRRGGAPPPRLRLRTGDDRSAGAAVPADDAVRM